MPDRGTRCSLALAAMLSWAAPVAAQAPQLPAEPIVLYLPPTVRSAGLNGASTALVGDAGAVFGNPAGLATIRHIALEGAYRNLPAPDAFVASGALGWRLRQFDLGGGIRYADLGSQPATFLGPSAAPPARDILGSASLVYRFGLIAVGVSGKRLERRANGISEQATSGDAGMALAFFDIMALAFSVENIGGNWQQASGIPMRRLTRLGFTMNYVDPQEAFRLLSVLELQWPEGEGARFVGGVEAGATIKSVGVIGRVAYGSRSLLGSSAANLTYGASLTMGRFDLDWAFEDEDLLGKPAHQFGLRLRL